MIGYRITNRFIINSEGTICDKPSFLGFLLDDHPGEVKVFYHLDADVASLLKLIRITEAEGRRLAETEKLAIPPYRMTYFPGRFFSIDAGYAPGHPYSNFSNMHQYTETHYTSNNNPEIAINQAKEAAATAKEAQDTLTYLGLPTDKLTSPVAAFSKQLEVLNLPTIADVPQGAWELAYSALKGNWLEAFTCSYYDKAFDWDINSAYPAELAKLYDIRRGRWIKHKHPLDQAVYGFASGYLTTRARFHPFLYSKEGEMSFAPVGRWKTVLTLQEIDFLREYNLGEFEPEVGWWWLPIGPQYHPFEGVIKWLFEKRRGTSGIRREFIHRLSAALWGKLAEFRGETYGPNFCPPMATIVETNTRIKVCKTCLDLGIEPLHIATDGIITDQDLPLESSEELGAWRLSHTGRCIIGGAGFVSMEGKGSPAEFSLQFDWLYPLMKQHPRASKYTMYRYSPITLKGALNTDFKQLGKIRRTPRAVYIGQDTKRLWRNAATTGGQLLKGKAITGEPLDYSLIESLDKDNAQL